jgi:CheY-like chemotaxis protein
MQPMLAQLGHTVETVADGHAALAAFERARAAGTPFDLVLLDLTIPGGFGGRDVRARLVELDAQVKAVAVSGYSADPAMADPRAHGFAATLGKPYTADDLARVIATALGSP